MKNNLIISGVVAAIISAAVASGIGFVLRDTEKVPGEVPAPLGSTAITKKEIRCGYIPVPPHLVVDPNTKKITGIIPDVVDSVANSIGYTVKWAEEVSWGTMIEGLNTGRYDAVCAPIWPSGVRAQFAEFSAPMYYSGVSAYVRANDTRFRSDLSNLNDPSIRIATIDGEVSQIIAKQRFPLAQQVSLPQFSDISQLLLNVDAGRADITFTEEYGGSTYITGHPGRLKNITPDQPVRVYADTIMFAKGDYALKGVFDAALSEMINAGDIKGILERNSRGLKAFYSPITPFQR